MGKLANVVAEVGELDRTAEGQIKAFVTGDAMEFEQKFKHPFRARPTARLVLATNNPPNFSDKSDGIWRRLLLLPFVVQIPEGDRVAGMDTLEYWQRAGEVPGLLNWAPAGLYDLRSQGRFAEPASCREGKDKLRVDCNPTRRFLDDHFEAGNGTDLIPAKDVYSSYKLWCDEHGHRC